MRRTALLVAALAAMTIGVGMATAKPAPAPGTAATIQATPNPVVYGSKVTISGQASGKNSGTARVTLYVKVAPSFSAAKPVATTTTSATGQYTFTTAPATNSIYFVKVHTAPQATSPETKVQVEVSISMSLTGGAGHMFFSGSVLPNYAGKSVVIQRRTAGHWKKVATAKLVAASPVMTALGSTTRSTYRKRLRLRSGKYRAFLNPKDGLRIANHSRTRKI